VSFAQSWESPIRGSEQENGPQEAQTGAPVAKLLWAIFLCGCFLCVFWGVCFCGALVCREDCGQTQTFRVVVALAVVSNELFGVIV
jgi:hypothetical protein